MIWAADADRCNNERLGWCLDCVSVPVHLGDHPVLGGQAKSTACWVPSLVHYLGTWCGGSHLSVSETGAYKIESHERESTAQWLLPGETFPSCGVKIASGLRKMGQFQCESEAMGKTPNAQGRRWVLIMMIIRK